MPPWVEQPIKQSRSIVALKRWFSQNIANTDGSTHSDLKPLDLSVPYQEAWEQIPIVSETIRGWKVESVDSKTSVIQTTRRTRLMGYIDDIVLRIEATSTGIRIHARSESRVGKGDLGQNRRNIQELFRTLRKQMGRS